MAPFNIKTCTSIKNEKRKTKNVIITIEKDIIILLIEDIKEQENK